MRQKAIFETHRTKIVFDKYNEPIYLYPFGDVHRENALCHREYWLSWCNDRAKEVKRGDKIYFFGMGDFCDLASVSEGWQLQAPKVHESTLEMMDRVARENTEKFRKETHFMNKDNLIGCLEGNHYWQLQTGITTTQYLCELYGCPYLGIMVFMRILFQKRNSPKEGISLDVIAHHGRGSGRSMSGSVNSLIDLTKGWDASLHLMGHDHKKSSFSNSYMKLTKSVDEKGKPHFVNSKRLYCRTGGFLRGYVPGISSYIAKSAMNPTDIGTVKVTMTPRRITYREDGKRFSEREILLEGTS